MNEIWPLTCDWTVVLVKVDAHASPLPSADATTSPSTQRNGHHPVDVGEHDGHTNTCGGGGRTSFRRVEGVKKTKQRVFKKLTSQILPTLTAAMTGAVMMDRATPPVMARFLLWRDDFFSS